MITNREQLIHLSREVERVATLLTRKYYADKWDQAATAAMSRALDRAHLAFGFGDDAEIAEATRALQEFKSPEAAP